MMHVLQEELEFFDEHRQEWLEAYHGKFALIQGKHCLGFFDTWEDAVNAGYRMARPDAFLVKEVLPTDRVHFA